MKKIVFLPIISSLLLCCSVPGWVPFFGDDDDGGGEELSNPSTYFCQISNLCIETSIEECLAFSGMVTSACNNSNPNNGGNQGGYAGSYGSVQDKAFKQYKTVRIGNQTWMAENLDYNPGTGVSACYDNSPDYCNTYGRLYDWETAMRVCPSGWRLPSKADWDALATYIGGAGTEGKKLKANHGWDYDGNGTDEFGFSALPGGFGYSDGSFIYVGYGGWWWNASEYDSNSAYCRVYYFSSFGAGWPYNHKGYLLSVRCVQD